MPLRSERNQLYTIKAQRVTGAIIPALCTGSHQNSAVKRAWARVVLGWVTSWEVLVLHLFLRIFKCYIFIFVNRRRRISWEVLVLHLFLRIFKCYIFIFVNRRRRIGESKRKQIF